MIDYTVIRSRRRTLALEVTRQGTALVRAPLRASDADIARFVDSHRGWLENIWQHGRPIYPPTRSRLRHKRTHGGSRQRDTAAPGGPLGPAHGRAARRYHHHRRPHPLRQLLRQNRLSFSLYLMAYPEAAIEYVVVHELAHIRHHDHSPAFYREVEAYLPDWRARRALLRR